MENNRSTIPSYNGFTYQRHVAIKNIFNENLKEIQKKVMRILIYIIMIIQNALYKRNIIIIVNIK